MKKIFTLLCAAICTISAWAAVPELLFGNEPVKAGVTYQTGYEVEELNLGVFVMSNYTQGSNLYVKSAIGESITVEVKADKSVAVCSVNGQCQNGSEVTKFGVPETSMAGSVVDGNYVTQSLDIHVITSDMTGKNPSELLSDVTVEVKVYYTKTPNEYATAKVIMTNKPESEMGGIGDAVVDNGNVRPIAGNLLQFNVNKPTKLEIYSITGALVMSQKIYATGTVSLDSLHPGIYIYKAGKTTGKMIIRK